MSPRKKEQNEQIREARRQQILDSALSIYVKLGYNGTDMDQVALHAGLAKGLVYYYFKTKQELFRAVFEWMLGQGMEFSKTIMDYGTEMSPVERLVKYSQEICGLAFKDPRMMQFYMRMPFDAYAIFGPSEWKEGMSQSFMHRNALTQLIREGVKKGELPDIDAAFAANCFWTVFVANLYDFTQLIGGKDNKPSSNPGEAGKAADKRIIEILTFCFNGLGVQDGIWKKYLK